MLAEEPVLWLTKAREESVEEHHGEDLHYLLSKILLYCYSSRSQSETEDKANCFADNTVQEFHCLSGAFQS